MGGTWIKQYMSLMWVNRKDTYHDNIRCLRILSGESIDTSLSMARRWLAFASLTIVITSSGVTSSNWRRWCSNHKSYLWLRSRSMNRSLPESNCHMWALLLIVTHLAILIAYHASSIIFSRMKLPTFRTLELITSLMQRPMEWWILVPLKLQLGLGNTCQRLNRNCGGNKSWLPSIWKLRGPWRSTITRGSSIKSLLLLLPNFILILPHLHQYGGVNNCGIRGICLHLPPVGIRNVEAQDKPSNPLPFIWHKVRSVSRQADELRIIFVHTQNSLPKELKLPPLVSCIHFGKNWFMKTSLNSSQVTDEQPGGWLAFHVIYQSFALPLRL